MARVTLMAVLTMTLTMATAAQALVDPAIAVGPVPVQRCDSIPISDSGYTAHDAIVEAGAVFQQDAAHYNDATMRRIAYEYFGGPWRGDFVAGYGIYAMVRAAMAHRSQLASTTRFYVGCVLWDIRVHPDTSMDMSCGGLGDTCAEEHMGRALAFAAHDAWQVNYNQAGRVQNHVDEAFAVDSFYNHPYQYSFLSYYRDLGQRWVVLFNHQTESPVYAMATIGHLDHIRKAYEAAGLNPPSYSYLDTQIEDTLSWMRPKIDPSTFEFKDTGCAPASDPWNGICNCADRNEWVGSVHCNGGGVERHPKHYAMLDILSHMQLSSYYKWPWNAPGFPGGAACSDISQGDYNWVFNCLFR